MAQTSTKQLTTKKRKNYLSYPYDYYAGQTARIFFDHVWVDDIVTIQYRLNQNKSPIYGYASQKFDAVARGQILVNGNFTLAFKEAGYLNLVNNLQKNFKEKERTSKDILNYWLNKNATIEQILDELYMSSDSGSDFEDLAESLEDYVWDNFSEKQHRKITRPDEFDYTNDYGVDKEGFDIVMTFGDYTDEAAEHTVKVINNVHIIGEEMVVTPDGSPIAVNYSFFASCTDEKISNGFNISKDKKPEQNTGDTNINDKLDVEYATAYEVTILEAWNSAAERITPLTGKDFYKWINLSAPYHILDKMYTTNINDQGAINSLRTDIKSEIFDRLNNIDINTWQGGYYYDLRVIKLDVKLVVPGAAARSNTKPVDPYNGPLAPEVPIYGPANENQYEINSPYKRTLLPIQFSYSEGNKWLDFSDDDEYRMKAAGITDPDDLARFSKVNAEGQVEMFSQNQRDTEIKADANLDKLKMIYGEQVPSFRDSKETTRQIIVTENKKQEELHSKNADNMTIELLKENINYWKTRNKLIADIYSNKLKERKTIIDKS